MPKKSLDQQIEKAAAKAVLAHLIERLELDEHSNTYALKEGAFITMDKQIFDYIKKFVQ